MNKRDKGYAAAIVTLGKELAQAKEQVRIAASRFDRALRNYRVWVEAPRKRDTHLSDT